MVVNVVIEKGRALLSFKFLIYLKSINNYFWIKKLNVTVLDKDECLCKFVRSSIGLIKSDKGKLTPVYYTPKMAEFLSGLEILFHVLIDRPTYDYSKVANKLNAELTSMEK